MLLSFNRTLPPVPLHSYTTDDFGDLCQLDVRFKDSIVRRSEFTAAVYHPFVSFEIFTHIHRDVDEG